MLNRYMLFSIFLVSSNALAFDNDYSFNQPNFNTENFLDLNKAEFPEHLNDQWYQAENGWRISSHSLTSDLTYLHTQVKLHKALSKFASMRLNYDQEIMYADKEIQTPELEFEVRPMPKYPVAFSIIGAFYFDKSNSDQGYAITVGERTKNYIRYSSTNIDKYHNQKTTDNSLYLKYAYTNVLDAAYHWSDQFSLRASYKQFTPLIFLFDDQVTEFTHEGYAYDTSIKYRQNKNTHYKVRLKGFEIDKSLTGTTNQEQALSYRSINLIWLIHQQQDYKFSFGIRDDEFTNNIHSTITAASIVDYPYSMQQLYSTVTHPYSAHQSWQLGLYLGLAKEPSDINNNDPENKGITETKLNYVWSYQSSDKKSAVFLHISFNLDNFSDDPGDGGGLTYQSTF